MWCVILMFISVKFQFTRNIVCTLYSTCLKSPVWFGKIVPAKILYWLWQMLAVACLSGYICCHRGLYMDGPVVSK